MKIYYRTKSSKNFEPVVEPDIIMQEVTSKTQEQSKVKPCRVSSNMVKALCQSLYKKWSFPLRISSVNVTKSAVSCGIGHIYWRNP